MKITAVKGFNDILPADSPKWRHVENMAREVFGLYGFREVRVPIVEKTEVFTRSIGEATDIVEKEMYSFSDKNDASLTLRPEGTAPVVRMFVQNALYQANHINKLYYMGPMFRYERPQKGRYRQFHQIGAEMFGAAEPEADAELMMMAMRFFASIGLTGLLLEINSLGCEECRKKYKEELTVFFSARSEKLCENCSRRLDLNPLRILDCKAASCADLKDDAPVISDFLCGGCSGHFTKVKGFLIESGVPFIVNERMVRGLDYYTKTTFEVTTDMLGAQNAVAAGGRYDKLCGMFGAPDTPAVGFAIGVERIILLLDETAGHERPPQVFIAAIGADAKNTSFRLLEELRGKNINCEMEFSEKSLKSQLRRADKNGYMYVLIIGDEELKNGKAILRNMSNKEQKEISIGSAVNDIARTLE